MKTQNGVMIIAGASKGLGRELALRSSENNFPVALLARNLSELKELSDLLKASNHEQHISIHTVDLADIRKTYEIFNDIVKEHSKFAH